VDVEKQYGTVDAVRDNRTIFIQRKRKCYESELQSSVPVHPYIKGKVEVMGECWGYAA
jgi:hypothetical protein